MKKMTVTAMVVAMMFGVLLTGTPVLAGTAEAPAILSSLDSGSYQVMDDTQMAEVVGEDLFFGLKLRVFGRTFSWKWMVWKTDIIDNTVNVNIGLDASID